MLSVSWGSVLLMLISGISGLRILNPSSLNCSQPGLRCNVSQSNCLDDEWLKKRKYTPNAPIDLEVSVDVKVDENGDLQPVLVAQWKAQDDGSIRYLNGARLDVMHSSTNYHLCITYIFLDTLPMQNLNGEKWSFSIDQVILDPEEQYVVTVYNLPKPNLHHTSYHVTKNVSVPDCRDIKMKTTKTCVDEGSLWSPNISATKTEGSSHQGALSVSFIPAEQCDRYRVKLSCRGGKATQDLRKGNNTTMLAVYDLKEFSLACCDFELQIQPFFPSCYHDCVRRRQKVNICMEPTGPTTISPAIPDNPAVFVSIMAGLVFTCAIACFSAWVFLQCRKRQKVKVLSPNPDVEPLTPAPRTVLIIYSQDHRLYMDIVLKLCAFLRAKCATEVVVDLLDSSWLGTVGRLPWLEQQRQRIDKVLILCSRGTRAKWDAMCGQQPVMLREDVRSPNDDMTTPAFNLILPDLQRAASLGKYLVAYFDEVSTERDVPSVFNIAVKYRLMKQFEELFFRIQDMEKYQPGRMNTIEGISRDDYFNCPSGQALKEAIQAFHAYQQDNHDWFEKECVRSEKEAIAEHELLLDTSLIPPILKCEPLQNEGPPTLLHEVNICSSEHPAQRVHELTPEVIQSSVGAYVQELDLSLRNQPQVHLCLPEVLPHAMEGSSVVNCLVLPNEPHLEEKPVLQEVCVQEEPAKNEDALPSVSMSYNKPSFQALQQLLSLQQCLTPLEVPVPHMLRVQQPLLGGGEAQPVELAEDEREYAEEDAQLVGPVEVNEVLVGAGVEEDSGERLLPGCDQGYGSRETPTIEPPSQSSLMALAALQNSLFMASPRTSGFGSDMASSTDGQQYSPSNDCDFGN